MVLCKIPRLNNDYIYKQHHNIDLCNGMAVPYQVGTEFTYTAPLLQLSWAPQQSRDVTVYVGIVCDKAARQKRRLVHFFDKLHAQGCVMAQQLFADLLSRWLRSIPG